jgi:hypothetical protein
MQLWIALAMVLSLSLVIPTHGADDAGWKSDARCTFYTGTTDVSGGYAGNCGYGDLSKSLAGSKPYGPLFFAGSPLLYRGGAGCGSCYEIRCVDNDACTGRSIVVTMTDFCPTEGNLPWCAPDKVHFDLSGYAMAQIVDNVAVGTTPIEYRRVPCPREGPAVVGVVGNPYWLEISVMNLAHWGSYNAMCVKDAGGVWKDLKRDWGTNFVVNEQLRGNISVQISDSESGDMVTLEDCIPEGWTTGNSFACQVNYDDGSEVATSDTGDTLPVPMSPTTTEPTKPSETNLPAVWHRAPGRAPNRPHLPQTSPEPARMHTTAPAN